MATVSERRATIDDLARYEGKAELIGGRIIPLMPTGRRPNLIAGRIFRSLAEFADGPGRGEVDTANMGFAVRELTSGRQSFAPDVSCYLGPIPPDAMRFIAGPPTFAVEVRSESDHGPAAEILLAAQRADYFEAGTLVVWDLDTRAEVIRSYASTAPDQPLDFTPGQIAHAEPAVPGWSLSVERMFA